MDKELTGQHDVHSSMSVFQTESGSANLPAGPTKIKGGSQYITSGKTHYQNNRQKYIDATNIRRHRNLDYINRIKESNPCVDCGNSNPIVLEFDHLPQYIKIKDVSIAARDGWSIEKLQEEINKCELVCANCHKIRTHNRR